MVRVRHIQCCNHRATLSGGEAGINMPLAIVAAALHTPVFHPSFTAPRVSCGVCCADRQEIPSRCSCHLPAVRSSAVLLPHHLRREILALDRAHQLCVPRKHGWHSHPDSSPPLAFHGYASGKQRHSEKNPGSTMEGTGNIIHTVGRSIANAGGHSHDISYPNGKGKPW
jgi:hypothetical protein